MSWYKAATPADSGGDSVEIVDFTTGTDAQIAAMLDAYYNDQITWEQMEWDIGDPRVIHLDAMSAANPNGSTTMPAQDITIVIVAHDHTDLAESINGHDKACITVQTKECLHNNTAAYNQVGHIYVNGNSAKDTSFTPWSSLYMRTYLNSTVYNAFQTDFKSMIKASKHYRHTAYNTSASEQVTDNIFLPSYPEIFGTASYNYYTVTNPTEGTQFEYYASDDTTRKIKYGNDDGVANSTAQYWWNGSASSLYGSSYDYSWCGVGTGGTATRGSGDAACGLAPAFAM